MSRGGGGPSRLGDLLEGVLERSGVREQVARQGVLEAWDEVVGQRIAGVTRALKVDGSVLFVEVRSSAWLMELNMMAHRILERLNEGRDEGRIERIHFLLAEKE